MPVTPPAEIPIDEALVRRLLNAQASLLRPESLRLSHADEGWDCSVWRLGEELAVRLPRRAASAPLIRHEQRFLPAVATRVEGIGIPAPLFSGEPDEAFPWPWSVVPWFEGSPGHSVPRAERTPWAAPLGDALRALHTPASGDYPVNPVRGGPLAERDGVVRTRLDAIPALLPLWEAGLAAAPHMGTAVWIHGDLHPGNLIARGGRLIAMIDFGDITAGDPAYDLAVGWLAFDRAGRALFEDAVAADAATRVRARAWAASIAALLLTHSDDNPTYAALGRECIDELLSQHPVDS